MILYVKPLQPQTLFRSPVPMFAVPLSQLREVLTFEVATVLRGWDLRVVYAFRV